MIKTCGNCKCRGSLIGFDEAKEGFFLCERIEFCESDDKPKRKAYVIDASDYNAALCVSSDFGCNEWEGVCGD